MLPAQPKKTPQWKRVALGGQLLTHVKFKEAAAPLRTKTAAGQKAKISERAKKTPNQKVLKRAKTVASAPVSASADPHDIVV
ncbi:hypothetical protein PC129_g22042 [Phytophthora cactorum]|nr:hypothetical protein PC112_g19404 [Phytophthora cactorum]KAG2821570.1 hypothetical protein PC113_g22456 [Phytophthora cactorum]KAG2880794.1 hypothetical protein PC115_g22417 [Phytophthora cactorum]KAG2901900.1 hypothetical protein PC117_g21622 [Phytophthora cactorum]KAG2960378.1 hypothetical protein PC118_g22554 [Phytophthora cactorum]